jgi:hypothetical protein
MLIKNLKLASNASASRKVQTYSPKKKLEIVSQEEVVKTPTLGEALNLDSKEVKKSLRKQEKRNKQAAKAAVVAQKKTERAAKKAVKTVKAEPAAQPKETAVTNSNKGECMEVSITLNGNTYVLPKLNNRRLFKLLRQEGHLPAESVGKTSSEVLECGAIKVYYKDTELFIGLNNKEDDMKTTTKLDLFVKPQDEVLDYEKELSMYNKLTDGTSAWDMIEDYLRANGPAKNIEVDENGHEVDAHKVLNRPVVVEYTPDEYAEHFSTDTKGNPRMGSVGDAELIKDSTERAEYSKDIGDKENMERNKPVFTRSNTISEEEAMGNLLNYMKQLEEVVTYEELRELQKEVYAKQNEFEYSLWYFFPKGGSKAFWTAYRTKKAIMLKAMEVDMKDDVKVVEGYIKDLESVKDYKELSALRVIVFDMKYNPATQDVKSKFWAAYRAKKAELQTNKAEHYAEQRRLVFNELVGLIKSEEDRMLNLLKRDIWKARLPKAVKEVLIHKLTQKQDGVAIEFNMEKAYAYMEEQAEKEYKEYCAKTYGNTAA